VNWLIRLYPPAWRRRYGREMAELIASQPASFSMATDLVAAAVDAWLNPQSSTAAAAAGSKGERTMLAERLRLRCAGHGEPVTATDGLKGAAVTLVGTVVLVWAFSWAMQSYGKNPYLESLQSMSWLFPFLYSQRYWSLKGRSAGVQAVFIGVPALILLAIALAAGWADS
jgi:hypothetical protein